MKKIALAAVLLFCAAGLSAQNIRSNELQDFSSLVLSGKLNVTLEPSGHNGIEIAMVDADMSRMEWGVKGGKLSIRLKANPIGPTGGSADVKIYYMKLSSIEASGGASVGSLAAVRTGIFTLRATGGANIALELYTSDLTVTGEGNSVLLLTGSSDYITAKATTKGKVDARNLQTKTAMVNTQLAGEIYVWGSDKIDARATTN
ncbi:MAG: DUF2807 domain-containing protein, partial [Rikenellaceae bacterium]|nr:DUF2807 domain-containing protein [Rikenellaceae bacterium]